MTPSERSDAKRPVPRSNTDSSRLESPSPRGASPGRPPLPSLDRIALFLDLDGTLLEFAPTPRAVVVPRTLLNRLVRLQGRLKGALAIVSGRELADVDSLLRGKIATIAGSHGREWRLSKARPGRVHRDTPAMIRARETARRELDAWPPTIVESKRDGVAFHWREVMEARFAIERLARRLVHDLGPGYRLQRGDHVLEIRRAGADKGSTLATVASTRPFRGRKPWMLGDDLTDEDAFDTATRLGGQGIIVGARRPTKAAYSLRDPADALRWLERIDR